MLRFRKLLLIILLILICGYISLPNRFNLWGKEITRPNLDIKIGDKEIARSFDLVLGLDLAGGSHLVFETDLSNVPDDRQKEVIQGLKDIIERRVNLYGVSEPNIQISTFEGKDRIIVELPGISDTQKAVDLIGQTAQLKFAEIGTDETPGIFPTDLTGADLAQATLIFDSNSGKPGVGLEFTDEGARKFTEITKRNIGKPVAIVIDQDIISAPVVQAEITGGSAQITGDFTLDEAKNLSIQLNAGALPVPVKLVQQNTIGAFLGAESIQKSVKAGVVGLLMVSLFMILMYGFNGFIASISLVVFGIITLSLYKLIPVVLTLPGIAGFLLSVGMAVDSNILIFERFKEERLKRNYADALEVSFGRAWDSIRDANIATLCTAFILANPLDWQFLHTSGPVRGFAITLALGILISLFTGIVVTRNLLRIFVRNKE